MRLVLIGTLACLLGGCAAPVRIDWAGTGQGILQSVCRNSTRCDVPACDGEARDSGPCDNPYRRGATPVDPRPKPVRP
jgi:hypothetical protein